MVTVRIPEDLKRRIDDACGDVPRERWVRRVLEETLDTLDGRGGRVAGAADPERTSPSVDLGVARGRSKGVPKASVSASPRAPVPEPDLPVVPLPKIAPRGWAK